MGDKFLAGLALHNVALGMVIFTLLVTIDIWVFGIRMRENGHDTRVSKTKGIFSWWGRAVLAAICMLLIIAWLFVAFLPQPSPQP